jgi:hypothetical protein
MAPTLRLQLMMVILVLDLVVSHVECGKYYCYLASWIGSEFIPANFPLSYFACQIIDSAHLFSTDPLLSYINRCTAHYSSVSFWTRNCLDQIKVITLAHPCHHFHTSFSNQLNFCKPNLKEA